MHDEARCLDLGISDMHFVAALDQVNGLRRIPCLFQGVPTGAVDGYGRIAGKPAVMPLHLGPGHSIGLANGTTQGERRRQSSTGNPRPPAEVAACGVIAAGMAVIWAMKSLEDAPGRAIDWIATASPP